MLNLPQILDIPQAWIPMIDDINKYRYFLLHSGRNSCKSHSVARFILWLGEQKKLRIMCGREVQKSIEDSVHALFRDLIDEFNLDYSVGKATIEHNKTGSTIRFVGLREQGVVSVKSMENISIAWIEEAQAISKQSLDTLIPTIRNPQAKVFFTMNRYLKKYPVYTQMRNRDDCLVMSANYNEIEPRYISGNVIKEAEQCKHRDERDYNHIWLGEPLDDADNLLFATSEIESAPGFEWYYNEANYGHRIMGVDFARYGGDKCVACVLEQKGPEEWDEIYTESWEKKDAVFSQGKVLDIRRRLKPVITVGDADGLGGPIIDNLIENGVDIEEFHGGTTFKADSPDKLRYANLKTKASYRIKDMLQMKRLRITHKYILEEMETIRFEYNAAGVKRIVPKEKMIEKYKVKSPDHFDALMMAVSRIDDVQKTYEKQTHQLPRYATDDQHDGNYGGTYSELPQHAGGW